MAMIRMEQIRGMNAIPTTKLKGGYQVVTTKKYLDEMPDANKQEGMKVYCIETETSYELVKTKEGKLEFQKEDATDAEIRALFGDFKQHPKSNVPVDPSKGGGEEITSGPVDWGDVLNKPVVFPPAFHNHDDRYIKQSDAMAIKNAYDIAVDNGFQGTEKEWVKSLHGKDAKQPTIKIGNVDVGDSASVINVGSEVETILDFTFPKPKQGPAGPSAYESAKKNGYAGTEQEWLASLKGPQGDKGEKGDTPQMSVKIGTVKEGDTASVKNMGVGENVVLDFVIPKAPGLQKNFVTIDIAVEDWKSGVYTVANENIKEDSVIFIKAPMDATVDAFKMIAAADLHCKYNGAGSVDLYALGTVPTAQIKIQLVII